MMWVRRETVFRILVECPSNYRSVDLLETTLS